MHCPQWVWIFLSRKKIRGELSCPETPSDYIYHSSVQRWQKKNLFYHHDNSCCLIAIVTRRILLVFNQTRGEQVAKAPMRKSHYCSDHGHHHGGCLALCCWQSHPAHPWAFSRSPSVFPSHWLSCLPLTALQNQAHLPAGVPQLYI